MKAARLRKRITVKSVTDSKDASGAPTQTLSTHCIRWAEIRPLGGREFYTSQQITAQSDIAIKIRYDDTTKTITPKHVIDYGGRTFDIKSIANTDERNLELILVCVEKNA